MYKCNECEKFFNEPVIGQMEQDTGYVEQTCPYCGSDYFEEAKLCPICKENYTTDDFCTECYDTIARELERIRSDMGAEQSDFEDLIANHFGW